MDEGNPSSTVYLLYTGSAVCTRDARTFTFNRSSRKADNVLATNLFRFKKWFVFKNSQVGYLLAKYNKKGCQP